MKSLLSKGQLSNWLAGHNTYNLNLRAMLIPNSYFKYLMMHFISIFMVAFSCHGQSIWNETARKSSKAGFELMIPSFGSLYDTDFPTAAALFYGEFLFGGGAGLKIDVPLSNASFANSFIDESETAAGNPYLGLIYYNDNTGIDLEFGLRLPLAPDDNFGLFTGMATENYDTGMFMTETATLSSKLNYRYRNDEYLILKVAGGADFIIPPNGLENELFLKYSGKVFYGPEKYKIGAGFTGLLIATEAGLSFGDRTIHDLGLMSSYQTDRNVISTYLKLPLDDNDIDLMNFVFGLSWSVLW